jgi:hypothetical protein
LTQSKGIDFATAVFYQTVCNDPENQKFISAVQSYEIDATKLPQSRGTLLLIPAAFYREHPIFGGGGDRILQVAERFGLTARRLDTLSKGSVTQNAEIILREFAKGLPRPLIIMTLSRGSSDLRMALQKNTSLAAEFDYWIQICGLPAGSPLADHLAHSKGLRGWFLRRAFQLQGIPWETVTELQTKRYSLHELGLSRDQVINIVGCPLEYHVVAGNIRTRFQKMKSLGPNDGFGLLPDSLAIQGRTYPLWGADHFFRTPEVNRFLYSLFFWLSEQPPFTS